MKLQLIYSHKMKYDENKTTSEFSTEELTALEKKQSALYKMNIAVLILLFLICIYITATKDSGILP